MYVVRHSEASARAAGSTGTKIAIATVPSGRVVQLITIKKEGEGETDGFISYMCEEEAENIRKRGRKTPNVHRP